MLDKNIINKLLLYFYLKEPIGWKNKLTWWYKLSCLSPSLLGLYIRYSKLNYLKKYGNFPWELESWLLICNGPLSYMGDVVTFGDHSLWKSADVVCASSETAIILTVIPMSILNYYTYSYKFLAFFSIISFISLYYKSISSYELKKGMAYPNHSPDKYILYHSLWHYIMCGGSAFAIEYLC